MYKRILAGGISILFWACQPKSVPQITQTEILEKDSLASQAQPVPVVGKLGTIEIPKEHADIYFLERDVAETSRRDSLFSTFIKEYRYYLEAQEAGITRDPSVQEEVAAYRDYLLDEYWEDEATIQKLKDITRERYKAEVELSHILVSLPALPSPEDTLNAYRKASAIYQRLAQNEMSFGEAARLYSQDTKTNQTEGYLGWFGPLQLVYSIENVAYQGAIGSISTPVRTSTGYHIVWVKNKRPYSGQVRIRHLVVTNPSEGSKLFLDSLKTRIESKEITFTEAVRMYSEDIRTKDRGGELAAFGIGDRMDPILEENAFALTQSGALGGPFQTKVGWHLIQLIEKIPFQYSEALDMLLEDKLKTDSRGEVLQSLRLEKAKQTIQWKVSTSLRDSLIATASTSLLYKTWQNIWPNALLTKALFTGDSQKITVADFVRFLEENQAQWQIPTGTQPTTWLQHQLNLFENQSIRKVYTQFLRKQPAFEKRVQQQERDIVTKILLNETVWEKAVADTLGQIKIFEKTQEKYIQAGRMEGVVMVADDIKYLDMANELMGEEKPYALRRGILPITFTKNQTQLDEDAEKRLKGLIGIMSNQPSYLVEIGGHADVQEEDSVSALRVQRVSAYLQQLGLDYSRIQEIDFGKTRPVERFDWQKNQRVTFQFLSNSREELAKIIQSKYGPVIVIKEGIFSAGEPWVAEKVPNKLGTYRFTWEDKVYEVIVEKILPPRLKTIREARGEVIKAYQEYLLQEFDRKLAEKYPFTANSDVVNELFSPQHP